MSDAPFIPAPRLQNRATMRSLVPDLAELVDGLRAFDPDLQLEALEVIEDSPLHRRFKDAWSAEVISANNSQTNNKL